MRNEIILTEFRGEGLQSICDFIPSNGLHSTASIDVHKYIELASTNIGLGIT
jgi:hypothetical protein